MNRKQTQAVTHPSWMRDTDEFHNTFFHKRMKNLRFIFPKRERERVVYIYRERGREGKGERRSGEEEEMDKDRKEEEGCGFSFGVDPKNDSFG